VDEDGATPYVGVAKVPTPMTIGDEPVYQPPPRSGPLIWVLVLGSLAVILLSIGVLFGWALRSTPGPSSSPPAATAASLSPKPKRPSPQAVAQNYLDALAKGDVAATDAQACSLLRGKTPGDLRLPFKLSDLVGFQAAEGTVTGKTATVPAKVSVPLVGSTNFKVFLVDEEGAWKVCGLGPA
jgi:hypothetical protein